MESNKNLLDEFKLKADAQENPKGTAVEHKSLAFVHDGLELKAETRRIREAAKKTYHREGVEV
jgi:hypothetical protein